MWRLLVVSIDLLGIAPFLYGKSLHGAFAQGLDVIQETGGSENVGGPYDDLTGFDCLGDLIGTAHLREADASYNKDDEA